MEKLPKIDIDWKKALVFFIVIIGVYYIVAGIFGVTHPFLMTLGIVFLLFVGDQTAANIDYWRGVKKRHKEEEERRKENK